MKFGVALPDELAKEFERTSRRLGYKSRSHAVAEAIRYFISENVWRLDSGRVIAGLVAYIYIDGSARLEEELRSIGHEYMDLIVSTFHIHLTRDICLETVFVKGAAGKIDEYVSKLRNLRDLENIKLVILASID
ncbi:MAG: CopG family ribbon-helix-helix protein [Nitrososphaerota archaeon]|nr:CopG family ribbon-helix-helix protein [Candidatus Bathyarchaeota archaeon]MCX8161482.1 CopG family ribbon-helix-helix protein [Candidatus Bathyarchaeota archaeon]MDW8061255.1 CopG family ribbon-helix-helix protein [Nitrososphaerota archaeon]